MKPNNRSEQEVNNRDLFFEILADHCNKQAEYCALFYTEFLYEAAKAGLHVFTKESGKFFEGRDKTLSKFLKTFKPELIDEKLFENATIELNTQLDEYNELNDEEFDNAIKERLIHNYYCAPDKAYKIMSSFIIFCIYYHKTKLKIADKIDFKPEVDLPKILETDRMLSNLTRCTISHEVLKLMAFEEKRKQKHKKEKQNQKEKGQGMLVEKALDNMTYEELKNDKRMDTTLNSAIEKIREYIENNREEWSKNQQRKATTPVYKTVRNHLKEKYGITKDNIQDLRKRTKQTMNI